MVLRSPPDDIFVWIMPLGMISYPASALGYGLTAMRIFRPQPVFLALVIGVNLVGCYLLVPRYGLAGAVAAWSTALICQRLLFAVATARRLRAGPAGLQYEAPVPVLTAGVERSSRP